MFQNQVNQGCDVGNVDYAVVVHIGCCIPERRGSAAQQIVDQHRHVSNIHSAIVVHIAQDEGDVDSEVMGVEFAEHGLLIAVTGLVGTEDVVVNL